MSKSKYYIDSKKTILRTANNLYEYALDIFATAQAVQEKEGLTSQATKVYEIYEAVYGYFKDSLLFGKAEAAAALAHFHREGLGVEKSEYKDKLYVSIGAKLGDQTCKDLLPQRNHKDVAAEADNWVKAIQFITRKCHDKDAEITSPDIVWAEAQLKYHCEEPLAAQAQEDPCKESPSLYPTLPHNEGGASTSRFASSLYPLEQVDETAMTGRDAEGSSCCVVM